MDLATVEGFRAPATRAGLALGPGEALLGGGTWIFSEPQPGTTGLVDLTGLGWTPTELLDDGSLSIAATCTVAQLLDVGWAKLGAHPSVAAAVRTCAEALVMSFKVQHTATVGGNIALALPAGALTSLAAGLGATAVVWTPDGGERREPVADLVTGVRTTSLAPGEVLRSVVLPAAALRAPVGVRRASLVTRGRSAAVVVGRPSLSSPLVVTVTASTTRPVVLALSATPTSAEIEDALAGVDCWYSDPHGAADWRRSVTALLVRQVSAELDGLEQLGEPA